VSNDELSLVAGTGLSFYFKVNGMPIFAKGANEIPLDVLPERGQNPETVSRILESAHATNMNMLRVWGAAFTSPTTSTIKRTNWEF
jgi:beta-galactosidase/beta-glucuronidase